MAYPFKTIYSLNLAILRYNFASLASGCRIKPGMTSTYPVSAVIPAHEPESRMSVFMPSGIAQFRYLLFSAFLRLQDALYVHLHGNARITPEHIDYLEGDKILKQLKDEYYTIALHVMGEEMSSYHFAKLIEEIRDFKGGKVQFVIGGPLGVSQKVLERADKAISFSKMTFTHQLIRLLLLEQVYRGFEILKGTEYHK